MKKPPAILLLAITVVVGLIAGAFLVRETLHPLDPSRLVPIPTAPRHLAKAPGVGNHVSVHLQQHAGIGEVQQAVGESFIASREAVRATYEMYTVENVLDRLFSPRPKAYVFQPSIYKPASTTKKIPDNSADSTRAAWTDPTKASTDEVPDDAEVEDEDDDLGEAHLWTSEPPQKPEKHAEIWDILTQDLPLFIFWFAVLIWIEVTAMLWRRSRDILMKTEPWRKEDSEFIAQAAWESSFLAWRPYIVVLASFGIFCVIKDSIDVFDKCFWNWDCWMNLDCNLRILTPAVAECTFDIIIPSIMLTALVVSAVFAACWACTRPYAAIVCLVTLLTGLMAVITVELFTCVLWTFAAIGFNYFYFLILPNLPDCPEWYEDLGSMAFSSDPVTKEIRDGDRAQGWEKVNDNPRPPTNLELAKLTWMERFNYGFADFVQRHCRWWRSLWNGTVISNSIMFVTWRRTRIFGKEHIRHLGSHDRVLLASNHRTYFDFYLISPHFWHNCGGPQFSMYPVRSAFFFTNFLGGLLNFLACGVAMFPPIVNTASMKKKQDVRSDGKVWNDYAMERTVAELNIPGTMVGLHPEGTRNKDPDPYSMLPCKPGVGRVALETEAGAHVIPIFIKGIDSDLWHGIKLNFSATPWDHPLDIVFGPHIDLTDLRQMAQQEGKREEARKLAADRVFEGIQKLAEEHKARVQQEDEAKGQQQAATGGNGDNAGGGYQV